MAGSQLINLVTKARPWHGGGWRSRDSFPSQLLVSFKFQCFVPDSWQWSRSKTQKKCFELRGRQPARETLDLQKRTIVNTKTKTNSNMYKHKYTNKKTITNSKEMFTVDREKTAAEIPRIYLQLEKFLNGEIDCSTRLSCRRKEFRWSFDFKLYTYLVIEFGHKMNNDLGWL